MNMIKLNYLPILLSCLLPIFAFGQWTIKKVDNGFDEPYKIAYSAPNNGAILKLESLVTEKTVYPRIIQDTCLSVSKLNYQVLVYDSITSNYVLSKGYFSLFSDEYFVIYDVLSNSTSNEKFYRVYTDNKFGVIRANDLTLNPTEIQGKILKHPMESNSAKSKAIELLEVNKKQQPYDKKVQEIAFYLSGGYHCDDEIPVDISFLIGNEYKKYNVQGTKSENSTVVFLVDDLMTDPMKADFLKASLVKLRFNESHCQSDYYEFKMTGSKAALDFISKP
jgi:hypothetical protein